MAHQIWLIYDFISHRSLILVINCGPLGYAANIIIVSIVRRSIPLYFYITDKGCLI